MNRSIMVALLVSYDWRWRAEHVPTKALAKNRGLSRGYQRAKLVHTPFTHWPTTTIDPKTIKVMRPINSAYSIRAAPR